ncbi:hypothetical protein ABII15_08695 [Streptomyces sp. HUAS MG91]|uniref:PBS lyase n=1 Tax=Streptomyces tabacisoli TaxID=3156398 RepID=A0AAU8IPD7_9ACTN
MADVQVGAAGRALLGILESGAEPAGAGGTALDAVRRTRPARSVAARVAAAGGADAEAAGFLRELTARHLGGGLDRWRALYDALAAHRGTLPELLAEELPGVAQDGPLRPPVPRSAHATLGLLLEHAAPRDAAAVLAALPERATAELLSGGAPPAPALVTAVVDHGDSRCRTALARHARLDSRVLARLLETGDAQVCAAVYRSPRATASLRRTIAHRLDTVPLDAALRAELTPERGEATRAWLAPLLGSGDPQLVAAALRRGARRAAQQYALVRVWERSGPDAVRALLDDPGVAGALNGPVVQAVTEALADAGDGVHDGARALRAQGEPYEDPARLPALLATTRGTSTLRDLLNEPYVHDIDALARAHAEHPFMPTACEELARHEAASDAQRAAFRLSVLNEPWRAGGRRAGNTTPPARRLAEEDLDDQAVRWAEGMAGAGLLDPADLLRTARPAAHALAALARLAERRLLDPATIAELRALTEAHLGERPESWAAFDSLLAGHRGDLAELIVRAGKADAGPPQERQLPPVVPAPRAPLNRRDRSVALAALDLLYSVAPDGAPYPDDPDVLSALAAYDWGDAPGLATPRWFAEACAPHGIAVSEDGIAYRTPGLAEVSAELPQTYGSGAQVFEHAYAQGVLSADALLALLPAHRLLLLPHDWRRLAFAHAWRAALARRLRAELGTDPDAWLGLAALASGAEPDGPTWEELLGRVRGAAPAPVERDGPRTPDEAIRLLERGNHLWAWPVGTLLSVADAEVVDAVLPRLGPDGAWLLAAHLLRHDHTPRPLLDRLLAARDPDALRVLAAQSRWLDGASLERLVDLDDPDVDLALLRHWNPRPTVLRIVHRCRPPLRDRVLAAWHADGGDLPGGGLAWLDSAEPDLVEVILVRDGARLGLGPQLLGCLRLLEHGGADRLARLAGRDLLGRTATTVCAKALASGDPAGVIRARLDRERAPEKLIGKLRRARHAAQARDLVATPPVGQSVDWAVLEAAHAEDPIPYWADLVPLPGVPEDVQLRHAALLPEPGPHGLPTGARLTRERARHGLCGLFTAPPATQVDGLLDAGLLTGADLLHLAAPAGRVLAYLSGTVRRTDAPPEAAAARAGLAALARDRLGTDPAAWQRVAERLTGRDPGAGALITVAALLDGRDT